MEKNLPEHHRLELEAADESFHDLEGFGSLVYAKLQWSDCVGGRGETERKRER